MDSFQLHYVNHYEAVPGQGSQVRLTSQHPYVRLMGSIPDPDRPGRVISGPAIYAKDGIICGENGEPVEERKLPAWFWDEARKCSKESRESVKLVLPEERGKPAAPPRPKRTPVIKGVPEGHWRCTEDACTEVIPIQKKGVHIAKHRRDAKRAAQPVEAGAI